MITLSNNRQIAINNYTIEPLKAGTRAFICGATGSGKSTLAAYLMAITYRAKKQSRVVILDPKRRYFPNGSDVEIFPNGLYARLKGKRIGVPVGGILVDKGVPSLFDKQHRLWTVQGTGNIVKMCQWLYRNGDARKPTYVYADETNSLMIGARAVEPFQQLLSEGRELNIGGVSIHQRPRNITRSLLSETERVYVGHLRHKDDRDYLEDSLQVSIPFLEPYTWIEIDQETGSSHIFRTEL